MMKKILILLTVMALLMSLVSACTKPDSDVVKTHDHDHDHDHDHNDKDDHDHDHDHNGPKVEADESLYKDKEDGKLLIICTLFPTYSMAKAIAPDADVRLLLPPGADSHSFEPTPKDMELLQKADLIVYTSEYMEEWIHRVIDALDIDHQHLVDASKGIDLMPGHGHHHDHDHNHD
ncbi:MAG: zinc ABC transporter substrate-binding protein, partial [Tissierellia bacterium]|nr:zinc ABC transporter substrate-binding protein [Tissierellia bacterium]